MFLVYCIQVRAEGKDVGELVELELQGGAEDPLQLLVERVEHDLLEDSIPYPIVSILVCQCRRPLPVSDDDIHAGMFQEEMFHQLILVEVVVAADEAAVISWFSHVTKRSKLLVGLLLVPNKLPVRIKHSGAVHASGPFCWRVVDANPSLNFGQGGKVFAFVGSHRLLLQHVQFVELLFLLLSFLSFHFLSFIHLIVVSGDLPLLQFCQSLSLFGSILLRGESSPGQVSDPLRTFIFLVALLVKLLDPELQRFSFLVGILEFFIFDLDQGISKWC